MCFYLNVNLHCVTLDCIMRAGLDKWVCYKQEVRLLLQGYGKLDFVQVGRAVEEIGPVKSSEHPCLG